MRPGPEVLFVEDEPGFARSIGMRLERLGCRVRYAETKRAARASLDVSRPDLVILDLGLPDGSGFEVLAKIRVEPRLKGVPVLILTGLDEPELIEWGFVSGANGYLTKPFDTGKLLDAIRILLMENSEASLPERVA